ncbi:GspE/PulE family protein [Flavobacterium sp. HJ-32-4]|uniref:GspE/PulE family protein n=1 Tax=Flavobacterium sp. HJ-32-4 TaxID=1160795 RepID=UPI00352FF8F5
MIPADGDEHFVRFYIDDAADLSCRDELELLLGKEVILDPVSGGSVEKALSLHYRKDRGDSIRAFSVGETDFLEDLLTEARSLKCSDIHFEAFEKSARIRFRIDGQLLERYKIEPDQYLELVNKVKIRSKLNITEKRLPQDGRITNDTFDIRVSILPTLFGEKIVLRLLGQDASAIELDTLGFRREELDIYLEGVKKPNGIILISGPTGSGKTTTLYATLRLLNDARRNIVTVEDPIEYTLAGINQVQLKEDIGLTFAAALRSFLRQDPDIIMLGEIRDPETALMAIRASLTGHLVLSTIHTNSATGTISRLIDMGIPPYLISETLNLSVAQRLVRKLCVHCREAVSTDETDFPDHFSFPFPIDKHFQAKGCNACYHTGYSGRIAIYELLPVDRKVAEKIKAGQVTELVTGEWKDQTLSYKAFSLLAEGVTSLEEIYPILITY